MLTESERTVLDGSNASRIEVQNDQKSESLADPLSGELEVKLDRDEQEGCVTAKPGNGSLASAGDLGEEKLNGFTDLAKKKESVNVDEETKESEEKVPDDSEEVVMVNAVKDSDGIQTELLLDKEVEPYMVSSHRAKLSDLVEDSKQDCSGKQGTKAENLDNECFMGLEPHESKDESSLDNETPPVTKVKLSDSDLVWAKVRSHPWWPGQVFDASAASDKAKKYFKKGSYLVTYFGDCSFAWNDATRIKPFRQHFSQMSMQSSLPDFLDAIDFALDEVSRRIEFGLACSCIPEEVYEKIKTQSIINPGIREDSSSIHGGDKVSSAIFFEPTNLVDYMKRLACSPSYNDTDELQFVSQRAKLLAFNRWKGYSDLPEFETLQGSVESAPKISPSEEEGSLNELKESVPKSKKTEQVYTKKRKTEEDVTLHELKESVPESKKTEQVFTKKRKTEGQKDDGVFEYEDATAPKKKEKTLAEFIAERRLSRSNGKRSDKKPECEKKRKVVHSKPPKSSKKIKTNLHTEDSGSPLSPKNDGKCNLSSSDKITPKKAKTSFGIGASILRVANQMHCSTPTRPIPCSNSTSQMAAKNNGSERSLKSRHKAEALSEAEPSLDETLSRPPNGKSNRISIDSLQSGELEQGSKERPCTNLVEDSMLESRDLKDSSKEHMVSEDKNKAETSVGEMFI